MSALGLFASAVTASAAVDMAELVSTADAPRWFSLRVEVADGGGKYLTSSAEGVGVTRRSELTLDGVWRFEAGSVDGKFRLVDLAGNTLTAAFQPVTASSATAAAEWTVAESTADNREGLFLSFGGNKGLGAAAASGAAPFMFYPEGSAPDKAWSTWIPDEIDADEMASLVAAYKARFAAEVSANWSKVPAIFGVDAVSLDGCATAAATVAAAREYYAAAAGRWFTAAGVKNNPNRFLADDGTRLKVVAATSGLSSFFHVEYAGDFTFRLSSPSGSIGPVYTSGGAFPSLPSGLGAAPFHIVARNGNAVFVIRPDNPDANGKGMLNQAGSGDAVNPWGDDNPNRAWEVASVEPSAVIAAANAELDGPKRALSAMSGLLASTGLWSHELLEEAASALDAVSYEGMETVREVMEARRRSSEMLSAALAPLQQVSFGMRYEPDGSLPRYLQTAGGDLGVSVADGIASSVSGSVTAGWAPVSFAQWELGFVHGSLVLVNKLFYENTPAPVSRYLALGRMWTTNPAEAAEITLSEASEGRIIIRYSSNGNALSVNRDGALEASPDSDGWLFVDPAAPFDRECHYMLAPFGKVRNAVLGAGLPVDGESVSSGAPGYTSYWSIVPDGGNDGGFFLKNSLENLYLGHDNKLSATPATWYLGRVAAPDGRYRGYSILADDGPSTASNLNALNQRTGAYGTNRWMHSADGAQWFGTTWILAPVPESVVEDVRPDVIADSYAARAVAALHDISPLTSLFDRDEIERSVAAISALQPGEGVSLADRIDAVNKIYNKAIAAGCNRPVRLTSDDMVKAALEGDGPAAFILRVEPEKDAQGNPVTENELARYRVATADLSDNKALFILRPAGMGRFSIATLSGHYLAEPSGAGAVVAAWADSGRAGAFRLVGTQSDEGVSVAVTSASGVALGVAATPDNRRVLAGTAGAPAMRMLPADMLPAGRESFMATVSAFSRGGMITAPLSPAAAVEAGSRPGHTAFSPASVWVFEPETDSDGNAGWTIRSVIEHTAGPFADETTEPAALYLTHNLDLGTEPDVWYVRPYLRGADGEGARGVVISRIPFAAPDSYPVYNSCLSAPEGKLGWWSPLPDNWEGAVWILTPATEKTVEKALESYVATTLATERERVGNALGQWEEALSAMPSAPMSLMELYGAYSPRQADGKAVLEWVNDFGRYRSESGKRFAEAFEAGVTGGGSWMAITNLRLTEQSWNAAASLAARPDGSIGLVAEIDTHRAPESSWRFVSHPGGIGYAIANGEGRYLTMLSDSVSVTSDITVAGRYLVRPVRIDVADENGAFTRVMAAYAVTGAVDTSRGLQVKRDGTGPLRRYAAEDPGSLWMLHYIPAPQSAGVVSPVADSEEETLYDLAGRPVDRHSARAGLYITRQGRKVVL